MNDAMEKVTEAEVIRQVDTGGRAHRVLKGGFNSRASRSGKTAAQRSTPKTNKRCYMNELKDLADRLGGYDSENFWEITKALKTGGVWTLTVRHSNAQETQEADDESN